MIKKLFTSILLCGVAVASYALQPGENDKPNPVTASFSNGTVTVNYDATVDKVSTKFINDALEAALGPNGANLGGPIEWKAAVNNIKLTGDWTNYHLKKDQNLIFAILDKLGDQNAPVGLDLSACQGFVSKFVSVTDYEGATVLDATKWTSGLDDNTVNAVFVSLPEEANGSTTYETRYIEVTENIHTNDVEIIKHKAIPGTSGQATIDGNTFTFALPTDYEVGVEYPVTATPSWGQTGEVVVYNGEKWVYIIKDWGNKQGDVTIVETYTYNDENNNPITQTNTNGLTQIGDDYYYIRYKYWTNADLSGDPVIADTPDGLIDNGDGTYAYDLGSTYTWTDENGEEQTRDKYNMGGISQDDQGKWWYSYQEAIVTDPVIKFSFDGYINYISSIKFPDNENFDFIPDDLLKGGNVTNAVLSNRIVAIGNYAFAQSKISTINIPSTLRELGGGAFEQAPNIKTLNFGSTSITRIRWCTFQDATGLEEFTFPATLIEIQKDGFQRATALKEVDLSMCHGLRLIGQQAFCGVDGGISALTSVKVCSHPKVIKGDEGSGAFHHCTSIKTVEVVGCSGTNLVECRCENNAFDPFITYVQTAIDNIEPYGARLIFPEGPEFESNLANNTYGYSSAFDYFVGDYKAGVPFKQNQSALEAYFKFAPRGIEATAVNWPATGEKTTVLVESDEKLKDLSKVAYGGNGWHEFMNVSTGIIIKNEDEHFLRTYSRTRGSGPVLLKTDLGITAYRAVDYISTKSEYVANKRGNYVFVPGDKNKLHEGEDEYLTKEQCEAAGINIKGLKTYSYATVAGTLYLRPLHPKYKDSNAVNEDYSYIPELTGVVLYSNKTAEDVFLIFASYAGTEYDLSIQYPHTGKVRRESTRLETDADDINMLQGSYGEDTGVAPVDPWTYADPENFKGGTYNPAKIDYRQFAYSISQEKWIRLQPGRMKYNRAFAKIPAAFFNNHNETTDQMPDFTLSDVPEPTTPEEDTDETEGGVGANTLLLIDYSFDDVAAETDGIKTINETQVVDDNAWYTLQGVKVTQPVKGGVYIHNNKKVVIK